LPKNDFGDGGWWTAAMSAASTSGRFGRPMRMHGRVHGVWVEARDVLALEEGGGRRGVPVSTSRR
jgi:hypothetical protein